MSTKIGNLEKEIEEMEKRREELGAELETMAARIKAGQTESENLIIAGSDTAAIDTQVSNLLMRQVGLKNSIKRIEEMISGKKEEMAAMLRDEQIRQMEMLKTDVMNLVTGVYVKLSELTIYVNNVNARSQELEVKLYSLGKTDFQKVQADRLLREISKFIQNIERIYPPERFGEISKT